MRSMFDKFGGYYSVLIGGVEFAKFAPSTVWSEVCDHFQNTYGDEFTYEWVTTVCAVPNCKLHGEAVNTD